MIFARVRANEDDGPLCPSPGHAFDNRNKTPSSTIYILHVIERLKK